MSVFDLRWPLRGGRQERVPGPAYLQSNEDRWLTNGVWLRKGRVLTVNECSLIGGRCRGNASVLALERTTPPGKPIMGTMGTMGIIGIMGIMGNMGTMG